MGLRGKNRLRKQRLDISLFSQEGQIHVIKNHVLSEKDEVTVVDLSSVPAGFKFVAVYLNHGSHAYAKVRFDQSSIDWFIKNLSSVESAVTRAAIWRYFWMLVMDKKMSSLKYMEFVGINLPTETVEQIISTGLANLSSLISNYIPQDTIK
jgi:aminopeptidase N